MATLCLKNKNIIIPTLPKHKKEYIVPSKKDKADKFFKKKTDPISLSPCKNNINPLRDAYDWLCNEYPIFKRFQPMSLGVHKELLIALQNKHPTSSRTFLRRKIQCALHWYVHKAEYHLSVLGSHHRIGLDGKIREEITESNRMLAQKCLIEFEQRNPKIYAFIIKKRSRKYFKK
jgi:sRNA-binding protein